MVSLQTRRCRLSLLSALTFGLVAAPQSALALGGAGAPEINEALIIHHLYVNPITGNDSNSGNASAPFRTLTRGLQRAQQFNSVNQGVTIHLAPGLYLEGNPGDKTAINMGATTAAPLIVQGQGWSPGVNTGDVIITGSEPWTSWQNDGGGIWSKPWPYQMPIEPGITFGDPTETIVPEVVRIMSGLFVNGEPYYMFRSAIDPDLSRLAPHEGAYWIDLGPDGARGGGDDRIRVRVPSATPSLDLNAQQVRVTTRGNLIHFWRPGTSAAQPTNIAFRNLVFEHSGGSAIVIQNHGGLIVEDIIFRNNKWRGSTIESRPSPATVRRCVYTGNGEQTIATNGRGMLYEDILIHNNARQSFLVRYLGWGIGAFKIGESSDTTFRRIRSLNNWGLGAWFDTGNLRCEIIDSVIAFNTHTAIFIENNNSWNIPGLGSDTTVEVRNCFIAHNNRAPGESNSPPGIQVGESQNVSIRNNLIAANDVQIRILGLTERGPQNNIQLSNNIIASANASQSLYNSYFGIAAWRTWFDTLSSATDFNTYIHPTSNIFLDRNANTSALLNLSGWRSAHLSNAFNPSPSRAVDANSTFTASAYTVRPLVSISPITPYLSESAGPTPAFRVHRLFHTINSSLTVNYTVRSDPGDAINGTDYALLPGTITIPAGQLHADIIITPVAGDPTEPLEPIAITLSANSSAYQLGTSTAQIFLDDEAGSLPSVGITATRPSVPENGAAAGQSAQFTFTRTGVPANPLTINFTISGTASAGSDYSPISSSITFPAGASEVTLDIVPIDNTTPEPAETVILTLQPQSGVYGIVPGQASATVTILDNDILSLQAIVQSVPTGGNAVTVPVTIFNPTGSSVNFTISPPSNPYSWGASSLNTAPAFEWVEIINNSNATLNGTLLSGPGNYTGNATDFLQGQFTWMTYAAAGYSGGWLRNPIPNNSANATRSSETLPLGFNFPFFGQLYSALHLHTNGFLTALPDPQGFTWSSGSNRVVPNRWFHQSRGLPSSDEAVYPTPRGAILPFWGHLTFIPGVSRIAYKNFPDRFVLTWQDMGFGNDISPFPSRFTFQTILYPSGDIDFQYLRVDRPSASPNVPTTGLTNPDISRCILVSYQDGFIASNLRVRLRYQPIWASSSAQNIIIPAGGSATVNITLSPANLPDGIHTLTIPITSNTTLIPQQSLPVSLGVGNLPGALCFDSEATLVEENAGNASLTVRRLNGFTGNITVAYRAGSSGTATEGTDFTAANGTLSWADGDASPKTITIPILDDFEIEGDETFTIELHSPTGNATLASPSTITVTIRDNDLPVGSPPTLTATPASPFQINLSWTSVPNASAFRIERSADSGATWQVVTPALPASTFTYADTALQPGTTYQYRIRAFNTVSQTNWATANATTQPQGSLIITLPQSAFFENAGNFTATITRTGPTTLPVTVQLSTDSSRVSIPSSVLIPANQTSANFTVSLLNDSTPQGSDSQVIISASVPGAFAKESFEYPTASSIHNQSGGSGWGTNWVDTYDPPRFTIQSGNLTYPGWGGTNGFLESLPNNPANAWRDLPYPRETGVLYVGVLMQLSPSVTASSLFFGIGDGWHTDARSWMTPLRFQLDASGNLTYHNGAFPTVWLPTGLATASGNNRGVNLLIAKLDFGPNNAPGGGDDSVTVWLNPTLDNSENEPAGGVTFPVNLTPALRISPSPAWGGGRYDEIRLATTFAGLFKPSLSGQAQFTLRDDDSLTGIWAWRNTVFGSPDDSGPAAPLADPDSDAIPNLIEYALASNPTSADSLPILTSVSGDHFTITFTHRFPLTDAVIEVQGSSDLNAWTTLWSSAAPDSPLRISSVNNGNGTATTTVRDAISLQTDPNRKLRLRVIEYSGTIADTISFSAPVGGTPAISISFESNPLPNGGSTSIPNSIATLATPLTYTIQNTGTGNLTVGNPSILSAVNCNVTLATPPASPITPDSSTTLTLNATPTSSGPWSFSVSLPTTDPAKNPYTWSVSGNAIPLPLPSMQVSRDATPIPLSSNDIIHSSQQNQTLTLNYTITNAGTANLTLSNASLSAFTNAQVTITSQPPALLPPGGSSALSLQITPQAAGAWSLSVSIPSNDTTANPYAWSISGVAAPPSAATFLWRPGGIADASGTWNTSDLNWLLNTDPTSWPNRAYPADTAQFGAVTTTRNVTLQGTLNVGSLVFSTLRDNWGTDWVLSGPGAINLLSPALINPANGLNAVRINAVITGTAGLTLNSSGTRNANAETQLAAANTYTGITRITGSTLRAMHNSALGAAGPGNHTEIFTNGRLLLAGTTPLQITEDIILKPGATLSSIRASDGHHSLTGAIINEQADAGIQINTPNSTLTLHGTLSAASLGGPSFNRRISLSSSGTGSRIILRSSVTNAPDGTTTRLLIDGNSSSTLPGIVELAAANTFTNEITIRRGTLLISHPAATATVSAIQIADGGLNDSASTLRFLTNTTVTITHPINFQQAAANNTYTGVIGGASPHTSTFNGTITILDSRPGTYQLTAASGGTVIFNGLITDGALTKALTKTGTGTVILARPAGNTFDGGLTIAEGTLLANNTSNSATGTGPVTVSAGARLGGTGIISGNVSILPAGSLLFHLSTNATAHDRLDIIGSLSLANATYLEITDTSAAQPGHYTLLEAAGGISGPLPSLILPSGWNATLSLSGNQLILSVNSTGLTPLQLWRQSHFGTPDPTGPAADAADPDADGIPNLIEYALGGNPTNPASRPQTSVATSLVSGQQRLTLTFTPHIISGLTYTIEASNDLATWTTVSNPTSSLTPGQPFTFTDSADLATTPRRFLRLRVSQQ